MTQAQYWRRLCERHIGTTEPGVIVDSQWCRAILEDAAFSAITTGYRGRCWVFEDGSTLIVTSSAVVVR